MLVIADVMINSKSKYLVTQLFTKPESYLKKKLLRSYSYSTTAAVQKTV